MQAPPGDEGRVEDSSGVNDLAVRVCRDRRGCYHPQQLGVLGGDQNLREPGIGVADHADPAVTPWLRADPVDDGRPVGSLVAPKKIEHAL